MQAAFQVNSTRETPKINSMVAALKVTLAALTPKINAVPTARKTKGAWVSSPVPSCKEKLAPSRGKEMIVDVLENGPEEKNHKISLPVLVSKHRRVNICRF